MKDAKLDFDLKRIEYELSVASEYLATAGCRLNNGITDFYKSIALEILDTSEDIHKASAFFRDCIRQENTQTDNKKEV